jgi:hypothetical protein
METRLAIAYRYARRGRLPGAILLPRTCRDVVRDQLVPDDDVPLNAVSGNNGSRLMSILRIATAAQEGMEGTACCSDPPIK